MDKPTCVIQQKKDRNFTLDALDARVFLLGYRDGQAAVDAEGYCEFCGTGPECGVCGRGR